MEYLISPFEISEMFHEKFDGFDFAEPYLIGEFKDDPKQGAITIGVRTPWYDIKYFVYSKASFGVGIANNKLVEESIQWAVDHLNAAVVIQTEFDQDGVMRFDNYDLALYLKDPDAYIKNRRETKQEKQEHTVDYTERSIYVKHGDAWADRALIEAKDITFLCTCQPCKKKFYEIRDIRIKNQKEPEVEYPGTNRDFDVYVHHDSNWSELAMMDAENVHFLCDCDSCVARMKRVRESRGEDILHKGDITVYVNHGIVWTDQTLVEAERVIFLCKCTKCKQHADHILELRREK